MRFIVDKDTIWEDTGNLIIHNYPPDPKTYSYATRVYKEIKKDRLGWVYANGDPIYFHDMPQELRVLSEILGSAQNGLFNKLPRESYLKKVKK